ncbi:SCF ubiquitin ligase complex subunit cdc4, partial [Thoreauomyces humboldtii]
MGKASDRSTANTAAHPNARAPKRRGSIGSASDPATHRNNDLQRLNAAAKSTGFTIPALLTPLSESQPADVPIVTHADVPMSDVVANLPSPTASPTSGAHFSMDALEIPSTERWPAAMRVPPEFAQVPALREIPHILNTFDDLPAPLKSYMLLELLRRCPFSTLQFVSALILPSLKRDFLGLLPVELGYKILQYLDLRSLGRCAVASRTWHHVVDGDGAEVAVWKRRLQCEGWYDEGEVRDEILAPRFSPISADDPMEDVRHASLDDGFLDQPLPLNGKQRPNDWPLDWQEYASLLHDHPRSTGSLSRGVEIPRHLYKGLYRRHHLVRQNWFHGRYKQTSFPGHAFNVVTCLQFDADKIVSGSDDQTMNIYDAATGALRKRLEGHEGGVWALQYWNNVLVSGSTDRTVRCWDMETGDCTHVFEGHTSTVRCLIIIIPHKNATTGRMEPEVPLIVTGSRDATLRVWRLPHLTRDPHWKPEVEGVKGIENPFFRHVLTGHSNSVRAIAGHGNVLVSGSYDSTVRVWDLHTGTVMHVCRGHREKVYSVGYSHELHRAVSGSMDTSVRVWCTITGAMLFNLSGHLSLVGLLELSPEYLVSAAADSTLRVWSPSTGQCLANLTGHNAAITCFHHDPKLNRIVSGSEGGVKVWELSSNG